LAVSGHYALTTSPVTVIDMNTLSPTDRTRIRRHAERARTDRQELYDVLDAGLFCHLGVVVDGSPRVIPTGFGREGDTLYLHGSSGARSLMTAAGGADVCVTVTILDGIVLARTAFHHSMNYRSATIFGRMVPLVSDEEKLTGLRAVTEHLAPGQWDSLRPTNRKELAATSVMSLPLAEASVKIRNAPPIDDEEDLGSGVWAGVLPVRQVFDAPVPDPLLPAGIPVPEHIAQRRPAG
jgi:hypothetical protein